MTGYTVHTGASEKFVTGWDNIFGDENTVQKPKKKKKAAKKKAARSAAASKKNKKKKKS